MAWFRKARCGGLFLLLLLAGSAAAQDAAQGRELYVNICARCHSDPPGSGTINPLVRTGDEIKAAVARVSPMRFLSGTLVEQDYADLAAYFVGVLGAPTNTPAFNIGGQWQDPAQPWWALSLTQYSARQRLSGVWHTFDTRGQPIWLYFVDAGGWTGPSIYTATLFRNSGPPFSTPRGQDVPAPVATEAGSIALVFSDRETADVTFVIDGQRITNRIKRITLPP